MSRRLLNPVFLVSSAFLFGTLSFALAGILERL